MYQLPAISSTQIVSGRLSIILAEVIRTLDLFQALLTVPLIATITGDPVITDQITSSQITPVFDTHANLPLKSTIPDITLCQHHSKLQRVNRLFLGLGHPNHGTRIPSHKLCPGPTQPNSKNHHGLFHLPKSYDGAEGHSARHHSNLPNFWFSIFTSLSCSLSLSLPSPSDSGPPGSCPGGIGPSGSPPENRESKSFVTLSSGLLTPQLTVASGVPYSHGGV